MGKLTIIVVCVVAAAIVAVRLSSRSATPERQTVGNDGLIRITPQRITMAPRLMTLCLKPRTPYGPHAEPAEIHVYANKTALDYRRDHPNEHDYPIGSTFVKEKYSHTGDENPEAATIMERRTAKGDVSDWNFSVVSLPDRTPMKVAGEMTCAECHQAYKDTGFVSSDSEAALRKHLGIE